jgi:hypothetical protein
MGIARPLPSSTAPARKIDEAYDDEGVAETLVGLDSNRVPEQTPMFANGPALLLVGQSPSPTCEPPATGAQNHRRARVLRLHQVL